MSDRMRNDRNAPAANISLHIERVVLEGGTFTGAQLVRLQSSMEQELTNLLRAQGLPRHSHTQTVAYGQLSSPGANQTPAQLGRAMAHGIYASLKPTRRTERDVRL